LHEEGKTLREIDTELKMIADKYKWHWSKYEIDCLEKFEKIYPVDTNWEIYIAIMDKSSEKLDLESNALNVMLLPSK